MLHQPIPSKIIDFLSFLFMWVFIFLEILNSLKRFLILALILIKKKNVTLIKFSWQKLDSHVTIAVGRQQGQGYWRSTKHVCQEQGQATGDFGCDESKQFLWVSAFWSFSL